MAAKFSSTPVAGEFTGSPLHIPWIMLCTNGERWCGWVRTANSARDFVTLAADRRVHEASCKGGLILATRMP